MPVNEGDLKDEEVLLASLGLEDSIKRAWDSPLYSILKLVRIQWTEEAGLVSPLLV